MSFRDQACEHLSGYRRDVLKIPELGVFVHQGREHHLGHILPAGRERWNIIGDYRDRFFNSRHGSIKLHRYFHHLTSSQALCINLFFPLVAERDCGLLLRCLGIEMTLPLVATFEYESTVEVAARRTSFDFHLSNERSEQVFVEVKYTEDGFGTAVNDSEHQQKFRQTYLPLVEASPFLNPVCRDVDFFLTHYQVLRNLVHITESSHVVFLFPSLNTKVASQAMHAREHFLTDAGRSRLKIVLLEDFVRGCVEGAEGKHLAEHFHEVQRKYLGFFGHSPGATPA